MSIQIRKSRNVDVQFKEDGVVKDKEYRILMLPATKGLKYFKKLTGSEGMESLTEDEIKDLVVTSLEWEPKKFDIEFSGNMVALLKLVGEIIAFNFDDVFTELDSAEQLAEEV